MNDISAADLEETQGRRTRARTRTIRRIRTVVRFVGATIFVAFVGGACYGYRALGVEPWQLDSDEEVTVVRTAAGFRFMPVGRTEPAGLIFLPGAIVDPLAYVPMARSLAEAGYPVALVRLPFRSAPFQSHRRVVRNRILAAIRSDTTTAWVVGGHSKGGRIAAELAGDHSDLIEGLVLVGTSHPRRADLSHLSIGVTKIFGTRDGLASEEEVDRFAVNLPPSTHFVRIEGGNHVQFAAYRYQLGDRSATISRAEQQAQLRRALRSALNRAAARAVGLD